ncbi:MAG: hypothetical protein AB1938_23090 [Myxococcota bacterium]
MKSPGGDISGEVESGFERASGGAARRLTCPGDQQAILSQLGLALVDGLEARIDFERRELGFTGRVERASVAHAFSHLPPAAQVELGAWLLQRVRLDEATLDAVLLGEVDPLELFSVGGAILLIHAVTQIPALVGEGPTLGFEVAVSLGVLNELSPDGLQEALREAETTVLVAVDSKREPVVYAGALEDFTRYLDELLHDAAGHSAEPLFDARRSPAPSRC